MRRLLLSLVLLGTGTVLAACGDSTSPIRSVPGARADAVAPPRSQVIADLGAIYPSGGVGTAANAQLTNVFQSMDAGRLKPARQQAAALCEFTKKQQAAGRLHAPDASTSLTDAVTNLCDEVYLTVGLGPGGIDVSGQDAIAVFIPACTAANVLLPDGHALVRWPAKDVPTSTTCTYNQDVTLVISPIDYTAFAPGSGPLTPPAGSSQWPNFYDITTVPLIQPNNPVTVGICQLEDGSSYDPPATIHDQLAIGHNRSAAAPSGPGFEVLPSVTLTHADLPCIPVSIGFNFRENLETRGFFAAASEAASALGRKAIDAVTPTPAYAGHGGLGGLTSSFSPFGAVYVPATIFLTPTTIDRFTTQGGISFSAVLANGQDAVGYSCVPAPTGANSNPAVGSFDGVFFYPTASGQTTITEICSNGTTTQTVQQVVTITSSAPA